jgi:hypothetical protein
MEQIKIEKLINSLEFHAIFKIDAYILFEVSYYTLGSNSSADFTTSTNELNRSKNEYNQCGQGQEDLLKKGSKARLFFEKWDKLHLKDLNKNQYLDMIKDLELLSKSYKFRIYNNKLNHIVFREVVDFSKT